MPNTSTSILSRIRLQDSSTWIGKLFLTLDIDWAHDDVLEYSIDLLESNGLHATWFATHETSLLDRIRANPRFEIGIHPNFNYLIAGDHRNGSSIGEVIDRLMDIVPEAVCARSHSLTHNSQILAAFQERGIRVESNHFIPLATAHLELAPWKDVEGMLSVPFLWSDLHSAWLRDWDEPPAEITAAQLIEHPGLKVLSFHPIHLWLNTESTSQYESTRAFHREPEKMVSERTDSSRGASGFLAKLFE